jgi:NAD-dependent deacetylase
MQPSSSLRLRLRSAETIVFLTGAGMSADGGIPTFRDKGTGLWERFSVEELAMPGAFRRDPDFVWSWYQWRRMEVLRAEPNAGHRAIAELAARRPGVKVVTQNVDDLHERAGAPQVMHLHGSLFAPRCFVCARPYAEARQATRGDADPGQPGTNIARWLVRLEPARAGRG